MMTGVRSRRTHCGFSMLELVVVLSVMTTILVIAQPRVAEALQRQRLRGAAEQLATDLKFARGEALRLRTYAMVVFDATNDRYAAWYIDTSTDPPAWAVMTDPLVSTRKLTVDLGGHPDNPADILLASFEGVPAVAFDPYGAAIHSGGVVLGLGRLRLETKVDPTSGMVNIGAAYEVSDLATPTRGSGSSLAGISPTDVGATGETRVEEPAAGDGKVVDDGKGTAPVDDGGKGGGGTTEPTTTTSDGLVANLLKGLLGR